MSVVVFTTSKQTLTKIYTESYPILLKVPPLSLKPDKLPFNGVKGKARICLKHYLLWRSKYLHYNGLQPISLLLIDLHYMSVIFF